MAFAIKKTAAIAIAAGLTFAGSAGIAAQDALAQEPAPAPSSRVAPPAPNMPDTVDFVVNKRVNPAALGKAGTGNASDEAKGDPVQGAEFTLTPITVKDGDRKLNIKDQADFNIMARMKLVDGEPTVEGATATLDKANATDAIATDENGRAKFEGMAAGAYLVTETETAAPKEGVNGAYIKSAPFIVFLPMTNEDGSAWLTEVHAFPKNSYLELDKTVKDADQNTAAGEGQSGEDAGKIQYTVKATVPSDLPGRQRDQFGVVDIFDNRELVFKDQANPVAEVKIGDTTYEYKTDYTVTRLDSKTASNYAPDEVGAKNVNDGYYISFTKPWELPAGGKVVITFKDAEMKNDADDKVDNTVRLINNYRKVEDNSTPDTPPTTTTPNTPPPTTPPETPPEDPVPHVTVSTYKAKISIFKYSELNSEDGYQKDNDKPLADAEFSLYRCDASSKLLDANLEVADDQENAHVVRKGKTDSEGNLVFEGLHVTSYEDDAEIPMEIDKGYCLKETKAPRGYIANPDVQRIKLNHTDIKETAEGNKEFEFAAQPYQIANKPDTNTPPFLPATGGMGVLIIALAGLAIIGGGVYAARRNSQSA